MENYKTKTWTMESNGHTLIIDMDTAYLLKYLDAEIQELIEIADGKLSDSDESLSTVGDFDSYYTYEEAIQELISMKEAIEKMAVEDCSENIFPLMKLKKNGTFNRTTKAMIKQRGYGYYSNEAFGWHTEAIRIETDSDTHANVVINDCVEHY